MAILGGWGSTPPPDFPCSSGGDHHEVISPILDEILDNVHILARDQYGNYVVQHVLINGKPIYQAAIIERVCPGQTRVQRMVWSVQIP